MDFARRIFHPASRLFLLFAPALDDGGALFIGILTGVEMIGNANAPQEPSLARQNRYFGVGYAVAAAATWFFLIRK